MSARSSSKHRLILTAAFGAALIMSIALPGPAGDVHAEACATSGYQPRVLVTDDVGLQETQYCMGGEWTTVSRLQLTPELSVITETVEDPRDERYRFSSAADFFDLKNYDPYKVIEVFKEAIESGKAIAADEKTRMRLEMAAVRTQAALNRSALHPEDSCDTRSRTFSDAAIIAGVGWDPPESTGLPGQPSQIDFVFAPNLNSQTRVAILNAIGQYELAVASQDAASRYPQRIVPHDPSDARPPTITFSGDTPPENDYASTIGDPQPRWPGERRQWVSGRIIVGNYTTPMIVGHEIGHVLGLIHSNDAQRVMGAGTPATTRDGNPWSIDTSTRDLQSVAFDACMFLPPESNIF